MTNKQSKKTETNETSLVLRVCRPDYTSHSGFSWPSEIGADVAAPDWKKNKKCGNGLHGWLYGQGDHSCVSYWENDEAKWMVLEVASSEIVMLGGKCKFPSAKVRFIGSKSAAADFIITNEPKALNVAVIGACLKVGDGEVVQVGSLGTATAGNYGTATAGNYGTATAGESGTATAGESGTATAGNYGTATAGNYGTATAGESGEIRIKWWDSKAQRYRTKIGYVGEDGIKSDTAYRLNDKQEFEEISEE